MVCFRTKNTVVFFKRLIDGHLTTRAGHPPNGQNNGFGPIRIGALLLAMGIGSDLGSLIFSTDSEVGGVTASGLSGWQASTVNNKKENKIRLLIFFPQYQKSTTNYKNFSFLCWRQWVCERVTSHDLGLNKVMALAIFCPILRMLSSLAQREHRLYQNAN